MGVKSLMSRGRKLLSQPGILSREAKDVCSYVKADEQMACTVNNPKKLGTVPASPVRVFFLWGRSLV